MARQWDGHTVLSNKIPYRPGIVIYKVPMQYLEGHGTGCRVSRPVCSSKTPHPCSKELLKYEGNENFTDSLRRMLNAGPKRCKASKLSTPPQVAHSRELHVHLSGKQIHMMTLVLPADVIKHLGKKGSFRGKNLIHTA